MNTTNVVRECVDALVNGFSEPVEYVVTVNGQREARRAVRRYEGLLTQLTAQSTVPLARTGANGPSGGKPGSRPPMNMAYANAVDTIHEGALTAWAMLHEWGPNPKWSLPVLLAQIQHTIEHDAGECPDECATVAGMARKWVHDARVLLGYESRKSTLADTVCGACGGTLVVAVDATSDVRCIGKPPAEPCGMVYGRLEWVSLLG